MIPRPPPTPGHTPADRLARGLAVALLAGAALAARMAVAGEFAVHPMRLELGGGIRSSALTLRNDDTVPLSFQVQGMEWTQDDDGQDRYQDATDLVYFPRRLTVAPGQEAVVRVGLRQGVVPVEKAYRLFIEELAPPAPLPVPGQAPKIRVMVRFGAPLFVRPAQPVQQLLLDGLALAEGQARWRLRNAGNQHEAFERIALRGFDATGAEAFALPLAERYLLAGRTRQFSIPVPALACGQLARLAVEVTTDKSEVRQQVDLGTPSCR
jgi:fimbrial chaperone protein